MPAVIAWPVLPPPSLTLYPSPQCDAFVKQYFPMIWKFLQAEIVSLTHCFGYYVHAVQEGFSYGYVLGRGSGGGEGWVGRGGGGGGKDGSVEGVGGEGWVGRGGGRWGGGWVSRGDGGGRLYMSVHAWRVKTTPLSPHPPPPALS